MDSLHLRICALVPALAVFGIACGQPNSPKNPETAIEVAVGEKARIPEGFPDDVPLPADFVAENVSALPAQSTYVVQGRVPGSLETVTSDLKRQIQENGWSEESPIQQEAIQDMKMMNFEKEGRMLNVTLFPEDDGTSVNVTTSPR